MKKKSIFFTILGSFLGLGIVLIIIGTVLGGRFKMWNIQPEKSRKSVSTELPNVSLTDTTDIQKLDLELSASSIKICVGDTFRIQGNYLSTNEVNDGTWTVESNLSDHFYTVNIFGLAHLPIPYFNHRNDDMDNITITIPDNITLEEVDLDLKAATVTIEELNCDTLDLELAAGDLTIDSINAKEADLDLSTGDITIKQYNITKSASLDCNLGNISLGSRQYAKNNICNSLEADCSMGDIDIYGKLTGESYLDCSMGNITLNLVGSHANYDVAHSDISMGDINYTTKDFTKKSNNSDNLSTTTDTTLYGTLNFSCSMGDIDVCYLYATPSK